MFELLHKIVVNFTKDYEKDYCNHIISMVKRNLDDRNLLPTFIKHSQFKRYEI